MCPTTGNLYHFMALMVSICQQEHQCNNGEVPLILQLKVAGTLLEILLNHTRAHKAQLLAREHPMKINLPQKKTQKFFLAPGNIFTYSNTWIAVPCIKKKKKNGLGKMQVRFNKSFPIFHVQGKYTFLIHCGTDQFSGPVMPSRGHFHAHDPCTS